MDCGFPPEWCIDTRQASESACPQQPMPLSIKEFDLTAFGLSALSIVE
jgi:hypothetical protein